MRFSRMLAAATACAALTSPAWAYRVPMDRPVTINGITTVCTGIGEEAQNDPRWTAYPVRVEFSNGAAQYLAGAHVSLENGQGQLLLDFDCAGSWALFQLPTGRYTVTAKLLAHPRQPARSASFTPPVTGQKRVVLEFKGVNANE